MARETRARFAEPNPAVRPGHRGPTILLVGSAGFVGAAVRRRLLAAGASLFCHVRVSAGRPGEMPWDLSRQGSGSALVRQARPDATINCVGYGVATDERDPSMARRINAELPAELASSMTEYPAADGWAGPRLIHLGSAFEYGSVAGPVSEVTACQPLSGYAETKLEGTSSVDTIGKRAGMPVIVARIATVYGPGERGHRLLPSLLGLRQSGSLPLTEGGQERDFTYVEDVAEGIHRLLGTSGGGARGIINLATGRLHTVRQFVEMAMATLGIPSERVRFGAVPYRPDEVWQGPIDVSRLEAVLGWKPSTGIAEGVRRTAEWVDRHGAVDD